MELLESMISEYTRENKDPIIIDYERFQEIIDGYKKQLEKE